MTDFEHPLSLLNDPAAFLRWHREVGSDASKRQLVAATRRHMEKHGTRAVLDVAEKMDDVIAYMEEFA